MANGYLWPETEANEVVELACVNASSADVVILRRCSALGMWLNVNPMICELDALANNAGGDPDTILSALLESFGNNSGNAQDLAVADFAMDLLLQLVEDDLNSTQVLAAVEILNIMMDEEFARPPRNMGKSVAKFGKKLVKKSLAAGAGNAFNLLMDNVEIAGASPATTTGNANALAWRWQKTPGSGGNGAPARFDFPEAAINSSEPAPQFSITYAVEPIIDGCKAHTIVAESLSLDEAISFHALVGGNVTMLLPLDLVAIMSDLGMAFESYSSVEVVNTTADVPSSLHLLLDSTEYVPISVQCAWYDFDAEEWSTSGCTMVGIENNSVECSCNHLTTFSALAGASTAASSTERIALKALSLSGASISIVCLFAAFLLLFRVRGEKFFKIQHKVLLHLIGSILGSQFIFLLSIPRGTGVSDGSCLLLSMMLLFFVFSSVLWSVCEASCLHISLVTIFPSRITVDSLFSYFRYGAWGSSFLFTLIFLASGESSMTTSDVCWLAPESNLLTAFLSIVLVLSLCNWIVYGAVIRSVWRLKNLKTALRGGLSFFPLLGLCWLFAGLYMVHNSIVWEYLFALFSATQGILILIYHCLMNPDVMAGPGGRKSALPRYDDNPSSYYSHAESRVNRKSYAQWSKSDVATNVTDAGGAGTDVEISHKPSGLTTVGLPASANLRRESGLGRISEDYEVSDSDSDASDDDGYTNVCPTETEHGEWQPPSPADDQRRRTIFRDESSTDCGTLPRHPSARKATLRSPEIVFSVHD
eukprot:m.59064 g.59064  ORF g.59064 m.59064 type:complete len:762 (-) comp7191_c0_seq4:361-2646(-)